MQKSKEAKRGIYIIIFSVFVILLLTSTVSAGFADWFKKTFTGKATSDETSLNITVGNTAPVVDYIDPISAQSVTETSTTSVLFYFTATDTDGVSNLNDASAQAQFNKTGETTRTNSSCLHIADLDSDTANYSCSIDMWYWDGNGDWTINVTIKDINDASAENSSTTFSLSESTCMVMSPTALTWPGVSVTSTDTLSDADPITVNNTCNKDITDGNIEVTAIDLAGETTATEYIYAGNFTVNPSDACEGTAMVNETATGVSGATMSGGNLSAGDGQEELYFCLEALNSDLSAQSFSTSAGGAWTIGIS